MEDNHDCEIPISMISVMVYEENRLKSFTDKSHWPYVEDCNCTPDEVTHYFSFAPFSHGVNLSHRRNDSSCYRWRLQAFIGVGLKANLI